MESIWNQISSNLALNTLYDIIKFCVSFLLVRSLYDSWFKRWRWGDWQTVVMRGNQELARRKISPARAKTIHEDDTELSVYIKGVVSFHDWLNLDVCSHEAKSTGLLTINKNKREIMVDLAKNPSKQPTHGEVGAILDDQS